MYLCYDIKGIQQFIFSVPRLKCVIGASGLISEFDDWAGDCEHGIRGVEKIFAAGGRGAFFCPDDTITGQLEQALIEQAGAYGLDLRIGSDADLTQALNRANRLYPYTEADVSGRAEPCAMSGLWPVVPGKGKGPKRDIHPLIWERVKQSRHDVLGQWMIDGLKNRGWLPYQLHDFETLQFLKNVSPHRDDSEDEREEASITQKALGSRNRWAVIAMDGNDMGRQFLAFDALGKDAGSKRDWLKKMSEALRDCTYRAFFEALSYVLQRWASDVLARGESLDDYCAANPKRLILPFRPLVLGGDDVTMLCHPSYAMDFVQVMAESFHQNSTTSAVEPRWPATQGALTMSAAILYAKVSFPLHMAIPYTEELLAHVKDTFRIQDPKATMPAPAGVDWDTITDTLVEDPAARRQRELCFHDDDLNVRVELTRRPYLIEAPEDDPCSLKALLALKRELHRAGIATSVLARILPSLQRPWSERVAFIASIGKRHDLLMKYLWEDGLRVGRGWDKDRANTYRRTGFPDALLLLEEEHRMAQSTVGN